jgi:hypothetical protein
MKEIKNINIQFSSADIETNEYLHVCQILGKRPSKLTLYVSIDSDNFWKLSEYDAKKTIKISEIIFENEEYYENCRYFYEYQEYVYLSFVELNDKGVNITALNFYYDQEKIDHEIFLKQLIDKYSPYTTNIEKEEETNFFSVQYEKDSFELSPIPLSNIKLDIALNYGPELIYKEENLLKKLNSLESGLFVLMGPRGSGKTHYLRYIIPHVKKKVYYYPTYLLDNIYVFNQFLNYLKKQRSVVLVLEDTDAYFSSKSNKQYVDAVLSAVESELAKSPDLQIVLSLNIDSEEDLEEDLLNSNAVLFKHYFDRLPVRLANKLGQKLKRRSKYTQPMLLSNIYNSKKSNDVIKRKPGY